jgi:hypothetical protein
MAEIEIPEEVTVGAQERFMRYLVGFVSHVRGQQPRIAGSGTLVSLGQTKAILTAAHVLRHLPKSGDLGLALPIPWKARFQSFDLQAEHCDSFSFGTGQEEPDGPDLGCLLLNDFDAMRISDQDKIFYNLKKRADAVLEKPYDHSMGLWYLAGLIDERTKDVTSPHHGAATKAFTYGINEVEILGENVLGEFDYFDSRPRKESDPNVPKSFEGTSGGALWHIIIGRKKDGTYVAWKEFLSGVPFYQSELNDGRRTIRCHGRRSIYDKICAKLADFVR